VAVKAAVVGFPMAWSSQELGFERVDHSRLKLGRATVFFDCQSQFASSCLMFAQPRWGASLVPTMSYGVNCELVDHVQTSSLYRLELGRQLVFSKLALSS